MSVARLYPSVRPRYAGAVGRLVVVVVFAAPVAAMFLGSLRSTGLPPPTTVELFPPGPTLANYDDAFDAVPLGRYALNSALVSAVAVPVAVLVASAAGFAAVRLPSRGARIIVAVALAAFMFPTTAVMVGRFSLFRLLGLTDGPAPLFAPALLGISPVFVLVYALAFRRLPEEVLDAAGELGATPIHVWWRVALPMVRPVTAVVVALVFALTWGDVTDALLYVTDERWFTMPLGLRALAELPPTEQPVMLAAAVLSVLPVIVVFFVADRWRVGRAV